MPTQQAFVHIGDWDAETRQHPALAWFEPVVSDLFDQHKWETPYSELVGLPMIDPPYTSLVLIGV